MREFAFCESCGSRHMAPVPCGLTFRDRLHSVRLDASALGTRTRSNYYDAEALSTVFTDEAQDRMLRETEGYGATRTDPATGDDYFHNRKTGDWERVPDDVMDRVYLGGTVHD